MKHVTIIITLLVTLFTLPSCHEQEEWENNPEGNFDALWTIIDEHYPFFAQKGVDWNAVGAHYRAKLTPNMTQQELFDLCAEMLAELHDGHVNLIATHDVSRDWVWQHYPANYNERLVDEHYLNFNYRSASGMKYQILSNNYGYLYYGSFASGIGEGNLDAALYYLAASDGLIIDVRNNGGGLLTNVETLVARFIDEPINAGSITHKNGPGHSDFADPYSYEIKPAKGRVHYNKPVVVLTNRASFSATNNFVAIMKSLPNVRIVGDITGGGSGLPFTSELPNGWNVRFSACPIYAPDGTLTEDGTQPDVRVDLLPADEARGVDTIIETAFDVLRAMQ